MVTYKLEQHLKNICNEHREYDDLLATWNINKRSYHEALKPILQNYPHYTEHGDSHSETIIANIELLLGEEQIRLLSPTDTWLILQASYLHDIGMSLLFKDIESEWETDDFQEYLHELKKSFDETLREAAEYIVDMNENSKEKEFPRNWPIQIRRYVTIILSDYYRKRHGEISKVYINKMNEFWGINLEFNGLIQNRLIELLGQIAYLHTQDSQNVMNLEYKAIGHNADYIHPRFVAEMIRMGDLLDVDNNRFNTYMYKSIGELPIQSQQHVEKHKATRHILITPDIIEYKADCPNQKVYREARLFLSWLIKETDFLAKEWKAIVPENLFGAAPKLGKTQILLQGQPDLNGVADLRFSISQEKAFQIIEGTNLYNDKYIFIRELIQNALDTCKLQMWRDLRDGKYNAWLKKEVNDKLQPYDIDSKIYRNYKVNVITKRLENNIIEIEVADNGTGISVDTLKQMCEVGTSYWGKKDIRKEIDSMPLWLKPTAGFGIGLQSIFLVTDYFEIISTCEGKEIKATVESRKKNGFVQIAPSYTGWQRGTKIVIHIPEEIVMNEYYNDCDPFDADVRISEFKIRKVLKNNCSATYFPICLYINNKKADEINNLSFENLVQSWKQKDKYKYQLGNDYTFMRIWDEEKFIYYELDLYDVESSQGHINDSLHILFKGIEVDSEYISYGLYHRIKMDIYGMETKETLCLNRKKLLRAAETEIYNYLHEIEEIYLDMIKEVFFNISDEEFKSKWGGEHKASKLFALFGLLKCEDKIKMKEEYFDRIQYIDKTFKVLCLNYKEGIINCQELKMVDIIKNINKVAVLNGVGIFSYFDEGELQLFLKEKMRAGELDKEYEFLMYNFYKSYIFLEYGLKGGVLFDNQTILYYIKEGGPKEIFLNNKDRDAFFSQFFSIKNSWNDDLDGKRTALCVIEEFADIAVKKVPPGISGKGYYNIHNIISPLLEDDIKSIEEHDKLAYISMILQREDFNNLINYVYENQLESKKYTLEHIRDKYIQLIDNCYDWYMKEKGVH